MGSGMLDGRVVIVTGGGRGLGRAHCHELASHGATVIVNDLGVGLHGEDDARSPADEVVSEIEAAGGTAVADGTSVTDYAGVAALVDRCCAHARLFAALLAAGQGVEILNDVVLNQVLVRFNDSDEATREVVTRVQRDGTCWLGGTSWHGKAAMRISVCNWSTSEDDVRRSAKAILAAQQS